MSERPYITIEEREGYFRLMIGTYEVGKMEKSQGFALLIAMQYQNLLRHDETRAGDFLWGVVQGMNHVSIIAGLPAYVPGLVNDPPSEDFLLGDQDVEN